MEKENLPYEERMDCIFGDGSTWNHRTLRTIFDYGSNEWKSTDDSEKIKFLRRIIESGENLFRIIDEYQARYREQGREDITKGINYAIVYLFQTSLIK